MARWLLAALALVVLAPGVDAQRGGRNRAAAARAARAAKPAKVPGEKNAGALPPIYLPGFDQPAKAPVGPKPKPKAKTPSKAGPPKPPDPMKEADQVTAAADHLTEVEKARLQFLAEHFRICDLDAGGWLSLREVEITLSLGRTEYRRIDGNQDGRVDEAEFSAQGDLLLARLGAQPADMKATKAEKEALAEPQGEAEPSPAPPASHEEEPRPCPSEPAEGALPVRPSDLLRHYDDDQSAGIDATEIARLFVEAGLVLSPELVVAQMDPDDSGQLESRELTAVAWLVSRHVPEALRTALAPPAPAAEGTGTAVPAERAALVPALGFTHFARLDPGRDGFIDEADLRALQSPSRLDLRFRALLSAMDRDGDGRLSEAEFQASMGARPR